jgi:hypothetical protein
MLACLQDLQGAQEASPLAAMPIMTALRLHLTIGRQAFGCMQPSVCHTCALGQGVLGLQVCSATDNSSTPLHQEQLLAP